jgi:hypothetical protein
MNILTTYRTFVGIIMFCQGWGMKNILRRLKHVRWRNYTVNVGNKLNTIYNMKNFLKALIIGYFTIGVIDHFTKKK